ncbi:MAG TPA: hypothetical protein VFO46_07765 [Candidatus Sulfotelmatobacter sp.]|nr:hypothetical protein [Candidatus Sulfotelmatobacter sp.]
MSNINFSGAKVSGNVQVGDKNRQTITGSSQIEISGLLELLREQIQESAVPAATKASMAEHVDSMERAAESGDLKSGFKHAFKGFNQNLEQIGTATERVSGIVSTLGKIAGAAGIAIKTVAPFVASML